MVCRLPVFTDRACVGCQRRAGLPRVREVPGAYGSAGVSALLAAIDQTTAGVGFAGPVVVYVAVGVIATFIGAYAALAARRGR